MNEVLFKIHLFQNLWTVTPWKLIGYLGVFIFAARWLVQVIASHRAGRAYITRFLLYN